MRDPLRWVLQATYPWVCGILTRTRKDQAHQVHFLVFDTTKLSIDAVCTVFNAAMNSAGDGVLEMLLDENVAGLMQYVEVLQKAGY